MMPSFKLKFQISQTTKLDNTIIIDKIVTKLNQKKYEVLEIKTSGMAKTFYHILNFRTGIALVIMATNSLILPHRKY